MNKSRGLVADTYGIAIKKLYAFVAALDVYNDSTAGIVIIDKKLFIYGQVPIFVGWAVAEIIAFLISALIVVGTISALQKVATVKGYDWYDGRDAAAIATKVLHKNKHQSHSSWISFIHGE